MCFVPPHFRLERGAQVYQQKKPQVPTLKRKKLINNLKDTIPVGKPLGHFCEEEKKS